jgi:4-hydroxybutyrate dehydrogenase
MPVMQFLTTCIFDHGALKHLPNVLKGAGVSRPLVVSDAGLKAAGVLDQALAVLGQSPAGVFTETPVNPTEAAARAGAALYQESGADGVVAVGGGASMDMGKAIAFWTTHAGPYERYGASQRGSKHIGKIPPLVAIPTTAGTGSEVSVGFVVILDSGRKETFVSPHLIPATAICDPDLTLGLPAGVTAATGMDAVTHCVEAVLSTMANPPAEGIGYDGVYRAIGDGWLARAVVDGADREARYHMLMASYEGALAFVKGLGAVHGLSHALGRLTDLKLHHGTLNAIILPHSLAMIQSAGAAPAKLARLRHAMGLQEGADLAEAVSALNAQLGIPAGLSALGVTPAHLAASLDYAVTDLATASNAIPFDAVSYEKLFAASL